MPLLSGSPQALDSLLSDGVASAGVLVVGGDVADAGVEADGVVVAACSAQFGVEHRGVADAFEVGPFGFGVPEQRFDPGLVGGGAGPSEALGDGEAGEDLACDLRGHLGAVV